MSYLVAHDIGTSGDKASLVDENGKIVKSVTNGYPTMHRKNGWAEQDPAMWWKAFCKGNRALLEDVDRRKVAGIVLTGQMMCALAVDKEGNTLYPAIIWADGRAGREARFLEQGIGEERYYEITGMRGAAGYVLPKLLWLKRNEPEIFSRMDAVFSPKDYITYLLTGKKTMDPETAAYTHAYDRRRKEWSRELLELAGIRGEIFPEVLDMGTRIAEIPTEAARSAYLPEGIPVIMGIGDGGAATLGAGAVRAGDAYISLGTSAWACMVTDGKSLDPGRRISVINYLDAARASGTMQAGGQAYGWLRKILAGTEPLGFMQMNEAAAKAAPGSGGMLFLPYLIGERSPYWDDRLRAAFVGMTINTSRAEMIRSVMEGVAMHLRLILEIICEVDHRTKPDHIRLVGGGAEGDIWCRIIASVMGVPVHIPENAGHAGTLGIAAAAGASLGIRPGLRSGAGQNDPVRVIAPDEGQMEIYGELFPIFKDTAAALREAGHRLSDMSLKK